MMKIIDEKPWSHILMEKDGNWILTFLIRIGPVENDVSIRLTDNEINSIKADKSNIEKLLYSLRNHKNLYSNREIKPPVWP
jgi:hypothetical protein